MWRDNWPILVILVILVIGFFQTRVSTSEHMAAIKTFPSSGTRPEGTIPAMLFKNTKNELFYLQLMVDPDGDEDIYLRNLTRYAMINTTDQRDELLEVLKDTHDAYMLSGSIQIFIIARFKI